MRARAMPGPSHTQQVMHAPTVRRTAPLNPPQEATTRSFHVARCPVYSMTGLPWPTNNAHTRTTPHHPVRGHEHPDANNHTHLDHAESPDSSSSDMPQQHRPTSMTHAKMKKVIPRMTMRKKYRRNK